MPPKTKESGASRTAPSTPSTPKPAAETGGSAQKRKSWVKRSPEEVIREQIAKLRTEVKKKEEEITRDKRRLAKLEQVESALDAVS